MKRYYKKLTILIVFILVLTVCNKNPLRKIERKFAIDLPKGEVVEDLDSHGGFHGDGTSYMEIHFTALQGDELENTIVKKGNCFKTPFSENIHKALYGSTEGQMTTNPLVSKGYKGDTLPVIENAYYLFLDRHSEAENRGDDVNLFKRASYNFSLLIFDRDENILYYYELDT